MVHQDWADISSRKCKRGLLVLALMTGLSGVTGCGQQQAITTSHESALSGVGVAASSRKGERGCSYLHFLKGRHAELAAEYEKALALYEKALECDPDAEFVLRKVPLLLLRLNRGKEAVLRLKEYLVQHPQDTISRMLLAKIYIRQGAYSKAAAQYRRIHQLDAKNTTSLLLLSELYLAENKYDMAETALRDVLAVDDRSYSAHLLLARLLVVQETFWAAQRHYKQALDITWSEGLQLEFADLLTQQEKFPEAIALYQEILHHDEENEEAQVALIHIYLLQGKRQKALKELTRLKKNIKDSVEAEWTIIRLHVRWEEYDKAITLLKDFLAHNEHSEALYLLAALYFQQEDYEKTLLNLQKIDPTAREYEDSLFLQVRTLKELNRHEQAVQALEHALEQEGGCTPDLYILLAGIYQFIGQDEKCHATFLRGLDVFFDDEQILYEYGLFLDHIDEQEPALKVMEQIITMNGDHAGALNYIGYTWADNQENLPEALRYISRAAKLKPNNGYIRDSLGWVYYQLGEYEKARNALEMAVEMAPDDPAILDHLAETYLALEILDKAKQTWRKALGMYQEYKEGQEAGKKSREEQARKRIEENSSS